MLVRECSLEGAAKHRTHLRVALCRSAQRLAFTAAWSDTMLNREANGDGRRHASVEHRVLECVQVCSQRRVPRDPTVSSPRATGAAPCCGSHSCSRPRTCPGSGSLRLPPRLQLLARLPLWLPLPLPPRQILMV